MEENPQKYTKEQIQYLKGIECDHFWFKARRLLILRLLQRFVPRESSILEVGCGTGENLIALKQAGYHGIGLDLQSEGLKNPSLKLVQGDARSLPFQDAMFNVVLLADVLEHVEEEEVLPEVFRVLAPGGWL
ncbi:MAG: putative S-adenosylmethionine-dependent methyltransferase [Chlamydiae bacterium]|nr:putative S-adenosylmethionine-dependent methyltransferase [Chlamydiota bacterium]